MSFIIPDSVFEVYYNAVDAMIDSNFGIDCTVRYPEQRTVCSNCHFNSVTNSSSNQYKSGGPIPFEDGICPYCTGVGYVGSTETEDIKLRCYFEKKEWIKLGVELNVKDGGMVTYGHIVDMPKCSRASYIDVATGERGYGQRRFKLAGEPILHGFKRNKYFIAVWNKAE